MDFWTFAFIAFMVAMAVSTLHGALALKRFRMLLEKVNCPKLSNPGGESASDCDRCNLQPMHQKKTEI